MAMADYHVFALMEELSPQQEAFLATIPFDEDLQPDGDDATGQSMIHREVVAALGGERLLWYMELLSTYDISFRLDLAVETAEEMLIEGDIETMEEDTYDSGD